MGRILPLLIAGLLLLAACGDDDPIRAKLESYSGITTTDQNGNVLYNDPDDWQDTSLLDVYPAYPNPAARQIVLTLTTTDDADVSIVVRTPSSVVRTIGLNTRAGITYSIVWDQRNDEGVQMPDGIYRVVFSAADSQEKTHTTHGDIQMKSTPN